MSMNVSETLCKIDIIFVVLFLL